MTKFSQDEPENLFSGELKLKNSIENILQWIKINEEILPKFEFFSQLPVNLQKYIATISNDPVSYKNLMTTNKLLSEIDHDYDILCIEPTKTEIIDEILNKLDNISDGEVIEIQFREWVEMHGQNKFLIIRNNKQPIVEIMEDNRTLFTIISHNDIVDKLWNELGILSDGPDEYRMLLDILHNRCQLAEKVYKCFWDIIDYRVKNILEYYNDEETDFHLTRIFNGLISLLDINDRNYFSNLVDTDKISTIYQILNFISNTF